MTDAQSSLEEKLSCYVCYGVFAKSGYRQPIQLPCAHIFCTSCVTSMSRQYSANCPTCLQEFHADQTHAAVDVYDSIDVYNKLIEASRSISHMGCENCRQRVAVATCLHCTEHTFLCQNCADIHCSVRGFRNHQIQVFKSMPGFKIHQLLQEDAKDSLKRCEIHGNEEIKLYCNSCQMLMCQLCVFLGHREHKMQLLKEAAVEHRKELCQPIQEFRKVCEESQVSEAIAVLDKTKSAVESQKSNLTEQIKEKFSSLKKAIEKQEQHLLQEVKQSSYTKLTDLDNAAGKLATVTTITESLMHRIDSATDEEVFSMKPYVSDKMQELSAKFASLDLGLEPQCSTMVAEFSQSFDDFEKGIKESSAVWNVEVNAPKEALVWQEITFCLYFSSRPKNPVFVIQIAPPNGTPVTKLIPVLQTATEYGVKYTPTVIGHHMLSIQVNKIDVFGSPFSVSIHDHPLHSWDRHY